MGSEMCIRDSTSQERASRLATTPQLLPVWLDRDAGNEAVSLDVEEELSLPGLSPLRLLSVVYRAPRPDGTACYSCAVRGPMESWWYFEEGRSPQHIKHSVSHVRQKSSCMLVYERIIFRGRSMKRKAVVSRSGGPPDKKRRRSGNDLFAVRSPPVGIEAVPQVWPTRALKRYPSFVNRIDMDRSSQGLIADRVISFARQTYRDVVSPGGCEPLVFTLPEECQSIGVLLADLFLEEYLCESVYALACAADAFDRLARQSKDCQFASVCRHSSRWCIGVALKRGVGAVDPAGVIREVTSIVDLDSVELLRSYEDNIRARFEQDAVRLVPMCYRELEWIDCCEKSLGTTLGNIVCDEIGETFLDYLGTDRDFALFYACMSGVFLRFGCASTDGRFVRLCAHACRWCIELSLIHI